MKKKELPNGELVDFVAEENIYSPLVYTKWVPPLGYNILSKEPMISNKKRVPIEVKGMFERGIYFRAISILFYTKK